MTTMMRALFALAFLAPAIVQAQLGAPDNNEGCPAVPPNIEGGDVCNVPLFTDCRYNEFFWPGSTDKTYLLLCTCFDSGTFACAEQGAPPSTDPSNDATCPSTLPSSGDMCSTPTSQDCQYRSDGDNVVTRCTCFDGTFGCSQPFIDADPNNHVNCPLKQPIITGGESCDVPGDQDCQYNPFFWMDSVEVIYIARCSCFDGIFACALAGVPSSNPSNDAQCPSFQPTLEGGDSCDLAGDIDCFYSLGGTERRCTCFSGSFACAEPAPTSATGAAPGNHPACPEKQPTLTGGDSCTAPSNTDCLYSPFYWPGSTEVIYISRCNCFEDTFSCALMSIPEADPDNDAACPATKDELTNDCTGPSKGDCQYRENSQNVLQCSCMEDGKFKCDEAFSPDADPENHPFCPLTEPNLGTLCDADAIPTDCMYREPHCGSGVTPLIPYAYKCSCMMGDFQCAEIDGQICPSIFAPCFAGDATVEVQDQGTIAVKQLQIGDKVHVGKNQYESIYSFGHYSQEAEATFLKVKTSASAPLLISADHMVQVQSRGFVPAGTLEQGDKVIDGSTGDELTIQSIRTVQAQGVFAPFTPSGKIVVNGILASSFVAMDEKDTASLSIIAGLELSHQWLAHTFEFPHRLMCHYLTQCSKESYTADGISTWVATPMKMSQWVLEQNTLVRSSLLAVGAAVLALFAVLEAFFLYPVLAVGAAAVGVWYRRRRNQAKTL